MTNIKHFTFNFLREHCFVVWKDDSHKAVLVDPGAFDDVEMAQLTGFLTENWLEPAAIILTHSHYDHIFGVGRLQRRYGIKVYMHPAEREVINRYATLAPEIVVKRIDSDFETTDIADGSHITEAGLDFEVIHTPGHSPGSVCYYEKAENILFSGDTLFAGTIGRTDLECSDYDDLIRSLIDKLMGLPSELDVFPGHGPSTTIGDERTHNPFLIPFNAKDPETGNVDGITFV
ncbi:MAG: MBL fold metallo-hydrolase [Bacteroidales bacterium]|nr:MBL fold metallo-hydrolase [Bacteroidales bacterium]